MADLIFCVTEFVHIVCEVMILAFADREAYYGDPDSCDVPLSLLLSEKHVAGRQALIGETCMSGTATKFFARICTSVRWCH